MKYYYNSAGSAAKLMRAGARVVVMFNYMTKFFDNELAAGDFLAARGFFKGVIANVRN